MTAPSKPVPLSVYWALLIVYVVWGTTLAAAHIGIQDLPPAVMAGLRFGLSGLLLIGFCLLRGEAFVPVEQLPRHCRIGFFLFFLGNGIAFWVLEHLPTGLAAMMMATSPFWMNMLASLIPPRERIAPLAILGIFLGFAGMMVLLWPQLETPKALTWPVLLSILGAFGMSFSWAIGSMLVKRSSLQTTGTNEKPPSVLMTLGIQNGFAGLLMGLVVLFTVSPEQVHFTAPAISSILYLVLLGTILATPCYYMVLEYLPMPVASTFAYVNPVIAVVAGWFFFQESVTVYTISGAAIILLGVLLTQLASLGLEYRKVKDADYYSTDSAAG